MNIVSQSISDGIKLPSIIDNVLECAEKKRLLVQLVSGLLASGHYTDIHPEDGEPKIKSLDEGASWKEDGFPRRRPFFVLDDAESLLGDIEFYAKKEA
jgi:hypothetical protein